MFVQQRHGQQHFQTARHIRDNYRIVEVTDDAEIRRRRRQQNSPDGSGSLAVFINRLNQFEFDVLKQRVADDKFLSIQLDVEITFRIGYDFAFDGLKPRLHSRARNFVGRETAGTYFANFPSANPRRLSQSRLCLPTRARSIKISQPCRNPNMELLLNPRQSHQFFAIGLADCRKRRQSLRSNFEFSISLVRRKIFS